MDARMKFGSPDWWEWECPHCGATNLDDYIETIYPMCCGCTESFDWDGILTPCQYEQANKFLSELE